MQNTDDHSWKLSDLHRTGDETFSLFADMCEDWVGPFSDFLPWR